MFTPSTKGEMGTHDENISLEKMREIVGKDLADKAAETSLAIYREASEYAASRGIIIADTKFEFGIVDGQLTLIDEVLTPRFLPLLARRQLRTRPQPAQLRQAVPARLARNPGVGQDASGSRPHPHRARHHRGKISGSLPPHHRPLPVTSPGNHQKRRGIPMILEGKKAVIFGVANKHSIAYGISSAFRREGASLAFSYLNDALKKRVEPISEELSGDFTFPCDVSSDEDIARSANS